MGPLVVDIGCGSGRLAQQLAPDKGLRYIGAEVVPRLIESAQALTMRDRLEIQCRRRCANCVHR
jgi:2-polyprenyl-3-methyl-5-hydroxy-6-metoxy-1,4-benzoquinol methylase